MLHASLLGRLEFTLDARPLLAPNQAALELLVYLASSPGPRGAAELTALFGTAEPSELLRDLSECREFLEVVPEGLLFQGSSDVNAYRASAGDLKALARNRGEFAPGLISSNPAFQRWLERERYALKSVFLSALLEHASKLERAGHRAEGQKNFEFVEREAATWPAQFAAQVWRLLARAHWRLNRPDQAAHWLELALPHLEPDAALEARGDLAAALVRSGKVQAALECLQGIPEVASSGWAWLHRANARRYSDDLELAVSEAERAYRLAVSDADGHLAVAALSVKGEALLELALHGKDSLRGSVIAFGQALGIGETLGTDANPLVLAGLAHAQAVWGNKHKALEQAERAYKRARTTQDSSATIRALLALYAATGIGSFARNALTEARRAQHKPYELLAALCALEKESSAELLASTLELARTIGTRRYQQQAQKLLERA